MASDILTIQEGLFNGLLSCALFAEFNVVLEREFLAQSEIEFDALWLQPRPARGILPAGTLVGAGFYIEMPKLEVPKPNSLQRNLVASIVSVEERNMNMLAGTGTGMSAEEMAELALDFMFGWGLGLTSGLTPEAGAITPAKDLVQGEGLVTYRSSVSLRRERAPLARCGTPTISEGPAGVFTLTNGASTPDADIYYTAGSVADGVEGLSFPGVSNEAAVKYGGPVALSAGQVINFAAWRGDRLPSHVSVRRIT